jgi:membrane-associated protease RseP (regulator of RpoE activity)
MSMNYLRGVTEWALMVALVFGTGATARAQEDPKSDEGVVKIGRPDGDTTKPDLPPPGAPDRVRPGLGRPEAGRPELPEYWIGLKGGDIPADHPLRAHLDLPEHQGLLVAEVVPKGPAAKAGLKQYDILLKANNNALHDMKDLIDLVKSEGPKKGQIMLEILRHNKRESLTLTPDKTPADAPLASREGGGGGGVEFGTGMPEGNPGVPDDVFQQLQQFQQQLRGRMPMGFRDLGPGVIVGGGGQGFGNMPNGVSMSITKEGDKPAHITLKRGDKTWEFDGNDAEALKKLPEDLRPFAERMLHNGGNRMHVGPTFGPEQGPGSGPENDGGRLRERLDRMEQRLNDLHKRLKGPSNPPAENPKDQNDQVK